MFDSEYDVESLVFVHPVGQDFRFLVTPRFRIHYETVEFEAFTHRLVSRFVRRAATFVDVGAHHGFYSLLAAHHNPAVRILACEPIPQTAEFWLATSETIVLPTSSFTALPFPPRRVVRPFTAPSLQTIAVSVRILMLLRSALK